MTSGPLAKLCTTMSSGLSPKSALSCVGDALDREVAVVLVAAVLAHSRRARRRACRSRRRAGRCARTAACRRRATRATSLIFPRSSSFVKIASAGGQVPTQTLAPASARSFAIAKPKPPSSATPATNARLPLKSIFNMARSKAWMARLRNPLPAARRACAATGCGRVGGRVRARDHHTDSATSARLDRQPRATASALRCRSPRRSVSLCTASDRQRCC